MIAQIKDLSNKRHPGLIVAKRSPGAVYSRQPAFPEEKKKSSQFVHKHISVKFQTSTRMNKLVGIDSLRVVDLKNKIEI